MRPPEPDSLPVRVDVINGWSRIFDIYLLVQGPQFEKADLDNLKQLLYHVFSGFWSLLF